MLIHDMSIGIHVNINTSINIPHSYFTVFLQDNAVASSGAEGLYAACGKRPSEEFSLRGCHPLNTKLWTGIIIRVVLSNYGPLLI